MTKLAEDFLRWIAERRDFECQRFEGRISSTMCSSVHIHVIVLEHLGQRVEIELAGRGSEWHSSAHAVKSVPLLLALESAELVVRGLELELSEQIRIYQDNYVRVEATVLDPQLRLWQLA